MERECRKCFHIKPEEEFYKDSSKTSGRKGVCKACVCYRIKERRYRKKNGLHTPIPKGLKDVRAMAYYQRLHKRFFQSHIEVEVPVKVINLSEPIPRGCVMRHSNGQNLLCLGTIAGPRQYQLEMVGPSQFLEIIKELGYELIVPERLSNGET